jgi:inorganic phosphate transporter, PiT family
MEWLLLPAVLFVAYANGANDNFKGVAALYGSRTTSYRVALGWATFATFAGSICAVVLAHGLLQKFSGKGIVPDVYLGSEAFLAAVALGAALTVLLATFLGFPISTTHALTGGIVGAGLSAAGSAVNFAALGSGFFLPLLLSPVMACGVCVGIYLAFRGARLITGVSKEWCVCVGGKSVSYPVPQPNSILALQPAFSVPDVKVSSPQECSQHYSGSFLGVRIQKLVDGAHFLSAGLVSFARGLNDTPKIAGLLLLVQSLAPNMKFLAIAAVMAVGGLLHSRKIAKTMSLKITEMNHGQGFAASLTTGLLVSAASVFSLPVSTTHVSVGSLFGIGITTRQANLATIRNILLAWLITLPTAGILSAMIYWLMKA